MSNNTGVFGLSGYNDKNLEGLIPDKTRESFREFGYFGGGINPGTVSRVDRIDYSNDTSTASVRGPLSSARYSLAATGNSNFGYFGGGSGSVSTVDRIDYSNDNTTASVRGPLSLGRLGLAATGNSNFGYFGGGTSSISTVDRLNYSNDIAISLIRKPLTTGRGFVLAATGNSNFGYFGGGYISAPVSSQTALVDRIDYSNDNSNLLVRGSLSLARYYVSATGNYNFGYFGGGIPNGSTVDRINYANDTATASPRGPLSLARRGTSAAGNSNFGYFGGGLVPGPNIYSTVDRIDYSNDTGISSPRGPLSIGKYYGAATSSSSFGGSPISQYGVFAKPFGYFGGGGFPNTSTVDRIDYSSDTGTATIRNTLTANKRNCGGTGNSNFGYFGGGVTASIISTVDRIDYSNDVSALLTRGPLSLARHYLGASGNFNFGYFGGGQSPTYSTVDRISYSNDTATALLRGPLSLDRRGLSATGTSNFGYFGGGVTASIISIVDRIDYSNDNATAIVRSNLTLGRQYLAATGNSNFGYFGGGSNVPGTVMYSTVDRIDYSSDTSATSPRGPLSLARYNSYAVSTTNFGYYGGGGQLSPFVLYSTVDRIDYANDTATASVRGPLSSAKYVAAAVSPTAFGGATDFQPTQTFFDIQSMKRIEDTTNASVKKRALGSFGYFIGRYAAPGLSIIERIDYSNDTATALVRGPLSVARGTSGATGNSNYGYTGAGASFPPFIIYSTIDRIDYSNDLSVALVRGPLSSAKYRQIAASTTKNFGYFGGGAPITSRIDRVDYSIDTATALVRGPLSLARRGISATGNSNFGYFGGGAASTPSIVYTTVDRVDYSNDIAVASVRGPLSLARTSLAATGNSNFGYFGGGTIPSTYSTVDRIDYSNDTQTASVRGPLSLARTSLAATGNSNFGYFGGGTIPSTYSTVDRIDYSNDTQTASVRGPLSANRYDLAATTNARNS